jgi:hypothetical protein
MKTAWLLAALLSVVVATTHAGETLQSLREGCWVCSSPEAYDLAIQEERKLQGQGLEELKKELLDKKLCMYADHDLVGRMMAPFAIILERNGTKVKVQFTVEYRKRIEFLHRQISRVVLAGWTDSANLTEKPIL